MEYLLAIFFIAFAVMWGVGFIWQFRVKKRFKNECPDEYEKIHRDGFQMKAKNDLRFLHYLLTRKYENLKSESMIGYLDTFRRFILSFFFVLASTIILVILVQRKEIKHDANQASHTMSANARLFCNDPIEINLNRTGTSTEAAIVWI